MLFLLLKFLLILVLNNFEGLSLSVLFISFDELVSFGLFVELEDGGDFGLEVLEEGSEGLWAGGGEVFVVLVGLAVGLLDLVDFLETLLLYLL